MYPATAWLLKAVAPFYGPHKRLSGSGDGPLTRPRRWAAHLPDHLPPGAIPDPLNAATSAGASPGLYGTQLCPGGGLPPATSTDTAPPGEIVLYGLGVFGSVGPDRASDGAVKKRAQSSGGGSRGAG